MKSRLVILLFAVLGIYIVCNRSSYETNMFTWDASGYYLYLPAAFIYHDIDSFGFYAEVNAKYQLTNGTDEYGMYAMPGGKRINKYAIGTALFEMPFFLLAHLYAVATHAYAADGYSLPYQWGGIMSFIFWVTMGLLYLRAALLKYFSDGITAFVLVCIAFGTNLYCYTIFSPGMSHPFEFFLFAGVLYHTIQYYASEKRWHIYMVGALCGLAIITRPVDAVIVIVPIFWQVYNKSSLVERFGFLRCHVKDVIVSVLLFLLIALIQMAYWKYISGDWIHYSYHGEGFKFSNPMIVKGLFSYQKGWFVYTPIAFVCVLGLFLLRGAYRQFAPSIVLFLVLIVYLVFSWRIWWYGGGFGARALIEALPLMAIPLAVLCQYIYYKWKSMLLRIVFAVIMCFFVALNMFQTYQYDIKTIHWVQMSKAYYWRVFGKIRATDEDRKLLMSGDDYVKIIVESQK